MSLKWREISWPDKVPHICCCGYSIIEFKSMEFFKIFWERAIRKQKSVWLKKKQHWHLPFNVGMDNAGNSNKIQIKPQVNES